MEAPARIDVREAVDRAREAMNVRLVFGDPYEQDGVVFVPAAKIRGGAGGGGGEGPAGAGGGAGTGFGLSATPAGAYEIRSGEVTWRPAFDVNRFVIGCQVVAALALLTLRSIVKARRTSRAA